MKKLLLVMAAFSAASALADDIQLGKPTYGGNGCPQGTASAALSPDRKTLSILFDQYMTQAGGNTGRTLDRKSCNIAVPVHVPQGYSIALFQMDYRGFNSLPNGANSSLNVEYFFAGQRGPVGNRSFNGPLNSDYLVTQLVGAQAMVWSDCGANTNLRINSSLTTRNMRRDQEALSTVDSTDIRAGLLYHIQWKRCN